LESPGRTLTCQTAETLGQTAGITLTATEALFLWADLTEFEAG